MKITLKNLCNNRNLKLLRKLLNNLSLSKLSSLNHNMNINHQSKKPLRLLNRRTKPLNKTLKCKKRNQKYKKKSLK